MSGSWVTSDDGVAGLVQAREQGHDLDAGLRIEVTGRFVGEQDRRIVDERAGDGDALPLTAGQFVGPWLMRCVSSTGSSAALARSSRSFFETPAYTSGSSTLWSAVARGSRLKVWNTKPISSLRMRASSLSFIWLTSLSLRR